MKVFSFLLCLLFFFVAGYNISNASDIKSQKDIDKWTSKDLQSIKSLKEDINSLILNGNKKEALSRFSEIAGTYVITKALFDVSCTNKARKLCDKRINEINLLVNEIFDNNIKNLDDFPELPKSYQDMVLEFIKDYMFDPDSAKFKDINAKKSFQKTINGSIGWEITGKMNGKNRFGGYTGFKEFSCFIVNSGIDRCIIDGEVYEKK